MATKGGGLYEAECTAAHLMTEGVLTMLVVVNGNKGSGLSICSQNEEVLKKLPILFREMANQVEREIKG